MAQDPTNEPVQPVSDLVRRAAAEVLRIISRDSAYASNVAAGPGFTVPIGVSNRHAHLSPGDLAVLFGPGYGLTPRNELGQPGQYAAEETVTLVGPGGEITEVRILGPPRRRTQVEILAGDTYELGLPYETPVGTGMPVKLVGPAGAVEPVDGAIVAQRHLHVPPPDAERYGLTDGMTAAAETGAPGRRVLFKDVKVRVSPTAGLELHLDREEAAGCGAVGGDSAFILIGGGSAYSTGKRPFRTETPGLLTEVDVIAAQKAGTTPPTKGVIITPYARDALRKYFPEVLRD